MAAKKRSNRLSGINPLAYLGSADALASNELVWLDRAPTVNDYDNWDIGTICIDQSPLAPNNPEVYMLVKKDNQVATWVKFFSGAIAIETLTGNSGGVISPDGSQNINILGDTAIGLTIVGNPATNTLTVTSSDSNNLMRGLTGDAGGFISSDANGNINILTAASLTTTGNPATNTVTISIDGDIATTYTTDSGNAIPALNVLNILGDHGINTSGAADTVTVAIDNAITLGDLSAIAAGSNALNCTTGDINIASGNIKMPVANAAASQGVIIVGGVRFIHNYGISNTFVGRLSGNFTLTSTTNTGVGAGALTSLTSGSDNTCLGPSAGTAITTGSRNLFLGFNAGNAAVSTTNNVGVGYSVNFGTSGSYNVGIGPQDGGGSSVGQAYTTTESSNILISNTGVVGDNNTIRIGTNGAAARQQNKCFIAGIRGITTAVADAIPVLIDSSHQLGTVSSSIRYKENVKDMADESTEIYNLRPVTFNYKKDISKSKQYGLIAEEVEKHLPRLVVYDDESQPETVKYHDLPVILLNELKRLHLRVVQLEDEISKLKQ